MVKSLLARQDDGQEALKLFANPFQGQQAVKAFGASIITSFVISALLTLLFSLLRPRHNLVYAPRRKYADSAHAPPPLAGRGLFSWVGPVLKTKEPAIVDKLGLDAAIFLRFTRMLRNIFLILGIIGVAIMIPVNVTMSVSSIVDHSNIFGTMTPLYIWGNGLWAQVVVAYAIDIIVAVFIWFNYRSVFKMRRQYLESSEYQKSLHARSVLLRHIPNKLRSEEGILQLTDQVNPTGSLPIATAVRSPKDITVWMDKHEDTVRKLEGVLAKYLRNPDRLPRRRPQVKTGKHGTVDAIDYYRNIIANCEQQIKGLRQQAQTREVLSYGFATWDHVSQAHIVAATAQKKHPQGTRIQLAPKPSDIIWQNMSLTRNELRGKSIRNAIWITLLTVAWTPLNAGMAVFLSNLSNLGSFWPGFGRELERHSTFWAIVQGILAPAITSGIYLLLPVIFRRLQIRAGDATKSEREQHVLRNLFNFFIINNLLIFSLFSSVWQYVTTVINASQNDSNVWNALQKGEFFLTVTTQLCQGISPFWVTWILQRNLGAAIDLAQLWTLLYQWYQKTFLAPTPRQYIEWTAPQPFQYAAYYNYFLFYAAVSLCFATLQPIILVCTALYFTLDSVLKKYLLMYVFVTKNESAGHIWRTLIDRLIFSCILADVIIGIAVKARGSWGMVYALIPLIFFMLGFKVYCARTFDPGMDFYRRTVNDAQQAEETSHTQLTTKQIQRTTELFAHPALQKKLMKPMVAARAKHLVAQIFADKSNFETNDLHNEDLGFSDDVALQPVKPRPVSMQEFEAVPEGQQDYTFYKNRSDFADVGGEALGRPEDVIRTGTPASMLDGPPDRSGTPGPYAGYSRSNSPAPAVKRASAAYDSSPQNAGLASKQSYPGLRNQRSQYSQLSQVHSNEQGDIALYPQHGTYTDAGDDQANLLHGTHEGYTPAGQFIGMEDFRTPGITPYNPSGVGSYDYFRTGRS